MCLRNARVPPGIDLQYPHIRSISGHVHTSPTRTSRVDVNVLCISPTLGQGYSNDFIKSGPLESGCLPVAVELSTCEHCHRSRPNQGGTREYPIAIVGIEIAVRPGGIVKRCLIGG